MLLDLILHRIRHQGPLTMAEYMEAALYHPEHGYYARAPRRSGREGDFFTSVDVGSLFGELLATQFIEMWRHLQAGATGGPSPGSDEDVAPDAFDLVEAGAGDGRLSRDVLDAVARLAPACYRALTLTLVERSPIARAVQPATLGPHAERLRRSGETLPAAIDGILFANELLDALPTHAVAVRQGRLCELYVDEAEGTLVERPGAPSTPRLAAYLEEAGLRLEEGWRAEINLAAMDWVRSAVGSLRRGFLLLVDYGHEARELYSATHAAGTLASARRHTALASSDGAAQPPWLAEPGSRDITSHVDLSATVAAAREAGGELLAMIDQTYFLLALASVTLDASAGDGIDEVKRRLALKTLILPGGLGSTHKVLLFGKHVGAPRLTATTSPGRLT